VDLHAYLTRYPEEIAFGDQPAVVFDRYHVPDFVLHNDGIALNRDRPPGTHGGRSGGRPLHAHRGHA